MQYQFIWNFSRKFFLDFCSKQHSGLVKSPYQNNQLTKLTISINQPGFFLITKNQIFLIDWQPIRKKKSSWRKFYFLNQLAKLYTYNKISIFWVLVILMFFIVGLGFQNITREQYQLDSAQQNSPINKILLFFLGSSIYLVLLPLLQKLEEYVQKFGYHINTNNSKINVKQQTFRFYLSKQIHQEDIISMLKILVVIHKLQRFSQTGLQDQYEKKANRVLLTERFQPNNCQTYGIYLSTNYFQQFESLISIQKQKRSNHQPLNNYRDQFCEKELKKIINIIKSENKNEVKIRSFIEKLLDIPPVNLQFIQGSPLFIRDEEGSMRQIFPRKPINILITILQIIFQGIILLSSNSTLAIFIIYFVIQQLFKRLIHRLSLSNISRHVKINSGFIE